MDEQRLRYIQRHFGASRLDPHLYDLMVDCDGDPRLAARVILTAMQADQSPETRRPAAPAIVIH
jgi:hypothetical protein